jgi:hypothetical protein
MEAIWSITDNTARTVAVAVVPTSLGTLDFVNRGAWAAETAYAVNDVVTASGVPYIRKVAGTTATAPASDSTNWGVIDSGPAPKIDWGDGTVSETAAWDGTDFRWEDAHTYAADGFYRAVVEAENGLRARHAFTVGVLPFRVVGGAEQRRREGEAEDTTMVAATRSRLG